MRIELDKLPEERDLIARMVLGYAEFEHSLLDMLGAVLGNTQTAVRAMFRLRSEASRADVASALLEPACTEVGLTAELAEATSALEYCKKARNTYAHCTFIANGSVLRYANLGETAKSTGAVCQVVTKALPLAFLKAQADYFEFTNGLTLWLSNELRIRRGQASLADRPFPRPKRMQRPRRQRFLGK